MRKASNQNTSIIYDNKFCIAVMKLNIITTGSQWDKTPY